MLPWASVFHITGSHIQHCPSFTSDTSRFFALTFSLFYQCLVRKVISLRHYWQCTDAFSIFETLVYLASGLHLGLKSLASFGIPQPYQSCIWTTFSQFWTSIRPVKNGNLGPGLATTQCFIKHLLVSASMKQNVFVWIIVLGCRMILNDVNCETFNLFVKEIRRSLFVISSQ